MTTGNAWFRDVLYEDGLVVVLRTTTADESVTIGAELREAGVHLIELTMTTPDAVGALVRLRELTDAGTVLGMGTVLSPADAERAIDAGAQFLVTPTIRPDVMATASRSDTPVLMGALTPTEVGTARELGAAAVKIFPASSVGAGYLTQLRGPLPDLFAVPSGGLGVDDVAEWITSGAGAVCLGSGLITGLPEGPARAAALRQRIVAVRSAIAGSRA